MSSEHPINQPIEIAEIQGGDLPELYKVGVAGVTRIEACTKSGLHADIPYIRIWKGDEALAEFCQHNIRGIYFRKAE